MIDTMGFGIREVMWKGQARRYFPLPDFDLTVPGYVILRIQGRFIDENYSRALLAHADMAWPEVLALDNIQKGTLPDEAALHTLRTQGLVEGRKPNLHVTAEIAAVTDSEAEYIRHRAFDDRYFCDLILEFLRKFREGKRSDFERLLDGKLSDLLNSKQKAYKIDRLLQKLRREAKIEVKGQTRAGIWKLPS
jgi:ATP-dependent DNA helicase RecG